MKYVTVWRLERDGNGPFQNYDGLSYDIRRRFNTKGHEIHTGCTVSWYERTRYHVFGCASYKDLRFYFGDKILRKAKEKGYEVKKYKVHQSNIIYGDREVAFIPPDVSEAMKIAKEKTETRFNTFIEPKKYMATIPS